MSLATKESEYEAGLLDAIQAATFLNLKISRLRYEIFKGRIPYIKIGRSIRFSKSDLLTWIESKKKFQKKSDMPVNQNHWATSQYNLDSEKS